MTHLYPAKLFQLFAELESSGALELLEGGARQMACNYPQDGRTRLPLYSPEVLGILQAQLGAKSIRVRIGYPPSLEFAQLSQSAQLEVYSYEGSLIGASTTLTSLPDNLAMAVEVELFHALLRAKGSRIPLLNL